METEFRRWARRNASFIGFPCTNSWQTWLLYLEVVDDRWKTVDRRDLHLCRSPVCSRRDVTPPQLMLRSHGGSDEPLNVIALCSWCHLHGLHEGRLEASGTADHVTW